MVYGFEHLSGERVYASSYFQFLETIDHDAAGGNDIIQGGKVKANLTAT